MIRDLNSLKSRTRRLFKESAAVNEDGFGAQPAAGYAKADMALWDKYDFPQKKRSYEYTAEIKSLNDDPELEYEDTVSSDKPLTIGQVFGRMWPKSARMYGIDQNMERAHADFERRSIELERRHAAGEEISPDEVMEVLKFPRVASLSFGADRIELVPDKRIFDELTGKGVPAGLCQGMNSSDMTFNRFAEDVMRTRDYILNEGTLEDEIKADDLFLKSDEYEMENYEKLQVAFEDGFAGKFPQIREYETMCYPEDGDTTLALRVYDQVDEGVSEKIKDFMCRFGCAGIEEVTLQDEDCVTFYSTFTGAVTESETFWESQDDTLAELDAIKRACGIEGLSGQEKDELERAAETYQCIADRKYVGSYRAGSASEILEQFANDRRTPEDIRGLLMDASITLYKKSGHNMVESQPETSGTDYYECDFPAWALDYVVNAELGSVSRLEKQQVDQWMQMMRNDGYDTGTISFGDEEYFSSRPEFGLPCDCVECKILMK